MARQIWLYGLICLGAEETSYRTFYSTILAKTLEHLTKRQMVTHYFEVGSRYLLCRTLSP